MRLSACATLLLIGFPAVRAIAAPPVTAAAFSPKGDEVLVGSQAGLAVFAWPALKEVRRLETRLAHLHDLAFSPDGTMLLAAGGAPAEDGSLECWSWPAALLVARSSPHKDLIYSVAWRSDGRSCITASEDREVAVLAVPSLESAMRLPGHSRGVLTTVVLNDQGLLLSAGRDQSLRLWDATTGKAIRSLDNHTEAVVSLAVRPRQPPEAPPFVASVSLDRSLRFWQPAMGRMVRFTRLASEPLVVTWTADGSLTVVSCVDGHVRAIDPDSLEIVEDLAVLDGWAYTLVRGPEPGEFLVGGRELQLKRVVLGKASKQ